MKERRELANEKERFLKSIPFSPCLRFLYDGMDFD
jgi:hypothetical protein